MQHTWLACTHQALVTILASQAWLRHTQAAPAWEMLNGGTAWAHTSLSTNRGT